MALLHTFKTSLEFLKGQAAWKISAKAARALVMLLWFQIPLVPLLAWIYDRNIEVPSGIALGSALLATVVYKRNPGGLGTRNLVAALMSLQTALMIYAGAGVIEYHFHVFVSLALLAAFRDFRPILVYAGLIAVHHLGFNWLIPTWVFETGSDWPMVFLHALFVVIESIYLVWDAASRAGEYEFANELRDITVSIAQTSNSVADTSNDLSQGASDQAAALEEITAVIRDLNQQTNQNAQTADQASSMAAKVNSEARQGSESMSNMVKAMAEISSESKEISRIIKVIDSIAFKTNLLALNAAVEAARAGDHGKGFAVVSEEVRNLAGMSADAAKEINGLIDSLVGKTSKGGEVVSKTSDALEEIIQGIGQVSDLMQEVATSSRHQSESINSTSIGLSQVDEVTRSNSAHATSVADASVELRQQVESLKATLEQFTSGDSDHIELQDSDAPRIAYN